MHRLSPTSALRGWDEIAAYTRLSKREVQEAEKHGLLHVHRPLGRGPRKSVYAFPEELDDWIRRESYEMFASGRSKKRHATPGQSPELFLARLLDEVINIRRTTFYRRHYFLRFELRESRRGLRARIECEFPLYNATYIEQPFTQEITIDDSEPRGWVEQMSMLANDKPIYTFDRPKLAEQLRGYGAYRGPEIPIRPISGRVDYVCRATWFNYVAKNLWQTTMVMPTVGVEVKTKAPANFEITPSYTSSELLLTAQHLDVGWNRRQ